MYRYFLLLIILVSAMLGCSEDSSRFPLISKRGDDGREFLYEWPDEKTPDAWIFKSTVSPDASEVAFVVDIDNDDYGYGLAVLNLDSGECRLIREIDTYAPVWSSSGEWIAYHAIEGPGTLGNIWLIRPDGSEIKPAVLEGNEEDTPAQWFNNEDKLFYFRGGPGFSDLCVYEEDTGEYYPITDFDDRTYNASGGVSPDDEWFASGHQFVDEPYGFDTIIRLQLIYVRNDGSDYRVEIREPIHNIMGGPVDWSPDGRYILFLIISLAGDNDDGELWTYEVETGEFEQLTMAPVDYRHPYAVNGVELVWYGEWASDGYIYFAADGKLYRIQGPV